MRTGCCGCEEVILGVGSHCFHRFLFCLRKNCDGGGVILIVIREISDGME